MVLLTWASIGVADYHSLTYNPKGCSIRSYGYKFILYSCGFFVILTYQPKLTELTHSICCKGLFFEIENFARRTCRYGKVNVTAPALQFGQKYIIGYQNR